VDRNISGIQDKWYYHLVKKAFAIIKERDRVSTHVIPEVTSYED